MKKYAIIVAGGTGTRMKGEVPKQFLLLNNKPVIVYSIEAFYSFDKSVQIILVIHPDYLNYWNQLCEKFKISVPFTIVTGGETRFDSVKNGLDTIAENGLVAIHDAARPLVTAEFIGSLFFEAEKYGSAMPGIPLNDTIRVIAGNTSRQLERTFLRAMQTPQVYGVTDLKMAYKQPFQPLFTDDASVMQLAGFHLHLTEGRVVNIKITNPEDLVLAETFLNREPLRK
jgi:2-C-methyl-D-erythritol 4-phosphate cytidylyltransferase